MEYRLKRQSDFDLLFKSGKRTYGKHLMMLTKKRKGVKIGYSLSKKHGNAVTRNRIKRLLRASVREYLPNLSGDVYIILLPKVEEVYTFKNYKKDVRNLLIREGLLK